MSESTTSAAAGGSAVAEPAPALVAGRRERVTPEVIERAVAGVVTAAGATRRLSPADRAAILDRVALALAADAERLAEDLARESGFLTHRDMVLEVERAIDVFTLTAAATREGFDDMVNVAASPRGRDTMAIVRRVPYGPVLGITAFNGPLLIAAHKVAPAIAAGAPIILKPAPAGPMAGVEFGEIVVGAGWPADALAVLPVGNEETMALIKDPRLPVVSFTGGEFGWVIKDAVPRKHVHLELGGVGSVIVAADADLDEVADHCVAGGFVRSGQACISVQRIYVHADVHDALVDRLAERVAKVRAGDPMDPETAVGPMVTEQAAERVQAMVDAAVAQGARVVQGGTREGALVQPTVLSAATGEMDVLRREIFGPVIAVAAVGSLEEAVAETNAVGGALHVGLFTQDIDIALTLADQVNAGGVIVNGANAWRIDNMPYGGTGTSGFGREGVRAMVEELTDRKVVVLRHRPRL
ncbi:aldehyde dehydrogenase family protein [Baekduia soli]|uniref:Aldehyde dehydrogenase family protein n=1 Tax=Baekduia soli TaxID=496014 RepID=A0A5B8U9H3_9ACTN|nr:aldehyde dehydrogenase family protein [Baekduia soli]QEC49714.1 aldehyde dehydrogenase family protein [Baekduia soli]